MKSTGVNLGLAALNTAIALTATVEGFALLATGNSSKGLKALGTALSSAFGIIGRLLFAAVGLINAVSSLLMSTLVSATRGLVTAGEAAIDSVCVNTSTMAV